MPEIPRIGLYRASTTDDEGETKDLPYSPVGLHLGKGLFHDTNGNLSVVPHLALSEPGAVVPEFSRATIDGPGWGDAVTVEKTATGWKVDGFWWNDFTIEGEGESSVMDGPSWDEVRFSQTGDTTLADGPLWGDYSVKWNSAGFVVQFPLTSFKVDIEQDSLEVTGPLGFSTEVERSGNEMLIDGPVWFDTTKVTRKPDRIEIDKPGPWNTYWVTHEGNRIETDGPLWSDHTIEYQ